MKNETKNKISFTACWVFVFAVDILLYKIGFPIVLFIPMVAIEAAIFALALSGLFEVLEEYENTNRIGRKYQ